jgi:sugar/nucleoside kinase (ribokinase family)
VDLGKGGFVVFERQTDDPDDPRWGSRLRSEQLPALGDVVVDRLGCGEAFLAAVTAGLVAEANLMQAAYLGAAVAGLEGMQLGSAPVSADDVRRFLSNRPEVSGVPAAMPTPAAVLV